MTDDEQKAKTKKILLESGVRCSFEDDPTLKDIAASLQRKYEQLKSENSGVSTEQELNCFETLYPSSNEVSTFAKEINNLPELQSDYKDSLNKIATTFSKAISGFNEHEEVNQQIKEMLIENFFHTARTLAIAVEARDPYTGGHSDRVFQISTELGKLCNISTTEQLHLEGGALLHDVGKIGIRDGVLLKPGPLTDIEYKEMQLHTVIGGQIVKKLNCLHGCVDAVLLHHERMDGYGYPFGMKGSEIPLIARITSVADAYDAMTTNRIYRKALSKEHALNEIMRNSGTQFDPEVVRVFVQWWENDLGNGSKKIDSIIEKQY